jgi:hypothetical protein
MSMIARALPVCAALLGAGCALESNWFLLDSGYSINPIEGDENGYAIEMHRNQLKQLGGEINSAEFNRFVTLRLKWHGLCPNGWQPLPCVQDGSCVQHTSRSVTVPGRCVSL